MDFFMNQVIIPFNRKHQFSVLLVTSERNFNNITEDTEKLYPPYSQRYGTKQLYPVQRSDCYNYVIARLPDKELGGNKQVHTEEILLKDELLDLFKAYRFHRGVSPDHVVLYTWLSPCLDCAELIIEHFGRLPADITKSVVYSTNFSKFSRECNKYARQKLRDANIDVIFVEVPRNVVYSYSIEPVTI